MNYRVKWIDCAKGIGIFLIVLGHVLTNGIFRKILYSVSVPLFFYLNGLNFNGEYEFDVFFKKKFKKIIIPYIFVSLFSITLYCFLLFLKNELKFLEVIKNIISMLYANSNFNYMKWNQPLWFLPCFFMSSIIFYFICKIKNFKFQSFVVFIIVIFGHLLGYFNIYLPFQFETSMCMLLWIYLGTVSRKINFNSKFEFNIKSFCFMLILLSISVFVSLINSTVSVRTDSYGNLLLYIICASLLIIVIQYFSNYNFNLFNIIGKDSLFILLFHKFPILIFQMYIPYINNILMNGNSFTCIFISIIISIVCICFCIILKIIWKGKKYEFKKVKD